MTDDPRDAMARSVTGTVKKMAATYYRRLRRAGLCTPEDYHDIEAAGWRGVAVALNDYRPDRGTKFNTYAVFCIRTYAGHEAKKAEAAVRQHGLPFADYAPRDDPGDTPFEQSIPDRSRPPVDGETVALARQLLADVPGRDREVLRLRFMEGLTRPEVAAKLGVTRERVKQIELRAVGRLRRRAGLQEAA